MPHHVDSDLPTNLLRIAKSSAARYDQTVETAVPPGISQRAFQARAIGERGSCTLAIGKWLLQIFTVIDLENVNTYADSNII